MNRKLSDTMEEALRYLAAGHYLAHLEPAVRTLTALESRGVIEWSAVAELGDAGGWRVHDTTMLWNVTPAGWAFLKEAYGIERPADEGRTDWSDAIDLAYSVGSAPAPVTADWEHGLLEHPEDLRRLSLFDAMDAAYVTTEEPRGSWGIAVIHRPVAAPVQPATVTDATEDPYAPEPTAEDLAAQRMDLVLRRADAARRNPLHAPDLTGALPDGNRFYADFKTDADAPVPYVCTLPDDDRTPADDDDDATVVFDRDAWTAKNRSAGRAFTQLGRMMGDPRETDLVRSDADTPMVYSGVRVPSDLVQEWDSLSAISWARGVLAARREALRNAVQAAVREDTAPPLTSERPALDTYNLIMRLQEVLSLNLPSDRSPQPTARNPHPFRCGVCGWGFDTPSAWSRHTAGHGAETVQDKAGDSGS